ncbi:SPOR domain-containing protein [Jannaschia sp. GRR-S6-38]|uniref:SPOR domain-containing protein n=1 Tax=Jannaschia ovalis TaxID=3038773 RepID=A0ABY8LGW2_9RHOB|nr:SPOR domain-containing protein [Jannaschia sp. GRR-S6-38]WGH80401.1 SPOR domain-containing protein [Jannaschia sp. GRR-S6-38]
MANAGSDATRAAPVGSSVQLIERDVEAPEVFQTTDRALWDGRPSLGGVWVAAPDVTDPERVIIRNEENGRFVIGALFKRERANPGPVLQLSSDAAAALGVLAGAPTTLDIVALRREEVPDPVAAPAVSAPELAEAAPAPQEEIVQTAAAPEPQPELDEAEAIVSTAMAALDASDADADVAAEPPMIEPAAMPERPRGNFFGRLFGGNQRRAARDTAPAVDPVPSGLIPDGTETPVATAAAPSVATTPLATTASGTPTRAPAPVAGLDQAYVQIGIFSVEENARNTATALSGAGVLPTVVEEQSSGRTFWRVIVGPATSAGDRAAVIRKAKDLGFTDAFAVRS